MGAVPNVRVKALLFALCLGSQVLCGQSGPRESGPSHGTVLPPSLL